MSFSFKVRALPVFLALVLEPLTVVAAAEPPAVPPGVKADVLMWIQDAENKLGELAAAVPQAKYSWRPAKETRSVADVFMHVVTANYRIPSFVGVKPPEGFKPETNEKSLTKKADIEQALKDSFAHVKKSLIATPDADLDKPVELFGMKTTVRGAYLMLLSHAHEHLGQSIAYARSNDIAPPWTLRRQPKPGAPKQVQGAAAKQADGY